MAVQHYFCLFVLNLSPTFKNQKISRKWRLLAFLETWEDLAAQGPHAHVSQMAFRGCVLQASHPLPGLRQASNVTMVLGYWPRDQEAGGSKSSGQHSPLGV